MLSFSWSVFALTLTFLGDAPSFDGPSLVTKHIMRFSDYNMAKIKSIKFENEN